MDGRIRATLWLVFAMGLVESAEAACPQAEVPPLRRQQDYIQAEYEKYGAPRETNLDYQARYRWYAREFFTDPAALEMCAAIEKGDLASIDRLLNAGLDVNQPGNTGMSFLLYSLMFSGQTTRRLIERGAAPDMSLTANLGGGYVYGSPAKIIARWGSPELFCFLLDHGMDRALLYRAALQNLPNLKILLDRGVDMNQLTEDRTPFASNTSFPPKSLLFYLRAGLDYRNCEFGADYPNLLLWMAVKKQELAEQKEWKEVYRYIEQGEGIELGKVLADYNACLDAMRAARRHGPSGPQYRVAQLAHHWLPREKDRELQFFKGPRVVQLIRAIDRNGLAEIDRLVRSGADVNEKGTAGVTPLFWATQAELKTFRKLLELGADPNARLTRFFRSRKNEYLEEGDTLVHWAACYGTPEHLRLVLEHGGDPSAKKPHTGRTPLFELQFGSRAAEHWHVDPEQDLKNRNEALEQKLRLFASCGRTDFTAQDYMGQTLAMKMFPHWTATWLLRAGTTFRAVDRDGFDLMLIMIDKMRLYSHREDDQHTRSEREDFKRRNAEIIALIEQRGGNFELAEQTVWKGDALEPSINLRNLAAKDRPWLPPERN